MGTFLRLVFLFFLAARLPLSTPVPAWASRMDERSGEAVPPVRLPEGLAQERAQEPWFIRLMLQPVPQGMFIRLPVVDTDPNRGVTAGVMPIWVFKDSKDGRIRHIHAPSVTHNPVFRTIPTYRYYYYPTANSALNLRGSISQLADRELMADFEDMDFLGRGLVVAGRVQYNVEGSMRFYGIGPDTPRSDETNFTQHSLLYHLRVGLPIFKASRWKFNFSNRMAGEKIAAGPMEALPDLEKLFPEHAPKHTHQNSSFELFMDYDTRDAAITPTRGTYAKFSIENAQRAIGSEYAFQRYLSDLRSFLPHGDGERFVSAARLRYEQLAGDAPFYLLPQLGGKYVHRGYGTGRYIDRGVLAATLEERIALWKVRMGGVTTVFELSPFAGVGTVFANPHQAAARYSRPVFGAAVRAIARPQVVGSVDFGFGQEGLNIFMDINYPF